MKTSVESIGCFVYTANIAFTVYRILPKSSVALNAVVFKYYRYVLMYGILRAKASSLEVSCMVKYKSMQSKYTLRTMTRLAFMFM